MAWPFGGSNPYADGVNDSLGQLKNLYGQWGNLGAQSLGDYQGYNSRYKGALNDRIADLQRDPYTDAYSTARLTQATAGSTAAYQKAKANLQAEMDRRGIGGSGSEVGGLNALNLAQAGQLAGAQNQIALDAINQRQKNQDEIVGLLGGARQNAFGNYTGALSQQGNLGQSLYSAYNDQSQQWDKQHNALQNALTGAISGAADVAGEYYAHKVFK